MKKILLLIFSILSLGSIKSQVGINTENPDPSSILHVVSDNKGVLLPKVTLTSQTDIVTVNNPAEGLIVYNTGLNVNFSNKGYVVWDGLKWSSIGEGIVAIDGLKGGSSTGEVGLGGTLSKSVAIDMDTYDFSFDNSTGGVFKIKGDPVSASTPGASPAIDITGKVKLTVPGEVSGKIKRLVVNNDGEVGIETPATIQSLMTYAQSSTTQDYPVNSATTTSFNSSTPIVVSFQPSDFVINAISTFNPSTNVFTISSTGVYEVSGFVNYQPSSNGSVYAAINVIIQYQAAASNTWNELSLSRMVFTGQTMRDITSTIVVPASALAMNAGDKIRMILVKPLGENQGNYGTITWGIKLPTGGKFSKAIRIMAI